MFGLLLLASFFLSATTGAHELPGGSSEAQADAARSSQRVIGQGEVQFHPDKWVVIPKVNAGVANPALAIDGVLDEAGWQEAASLNGFATAYYEYPVMHTIDYRLLFDDEYLYVGGQIATEEADSIAQIELVLKPSPTSVNYYVARIPVHSSHPASRARLNTVWNPSLNELSSDEGRVNVSGVRSKVDHSDEMVTVEAAVPLRTIAPTGVKSGDEWEINVIHVHHLYTKPLTSWIPIRTSNQWDTGQSRTGAAVQLYGNVVGEGRMGSLFFETVPQGASAPHGGANDKAVADATLSYVDFTRKRLHLPRGMVVDDALIKTALERGALRWQSPRSGWDEVSNVEVTIDDDGVSIAFDHPAPRYDGIYKLMLSFPGQNKGTAPFYLLTFDREAMIQAGLSLIPPVAVEPGERRHVEWKEPSEQVLEAIELIPPQQGFRYSGLPEMPELFPDGSYLYRLSADKKSLIAIPTGTTYPSDDPRLRENKVLHFLDRKGDPATYPYYEDDQGRRYFITGHLWYLQKDQAIAMAEALATTDPLGAARVLYAYAQAYAGYHPTVDRNWINDVVPHDSGPPYPYWGGMWSRWWWGDLGVVGRLAGVYEKLKDTNALELLSEEVGEDVERKLIDEMFLPSIDFVLTYPISQGNMANSLWRGLIRIGLALNDPDIIHRAVELISNFVIEGQFLSDGFWSEITLSYHSQTIYGLVQSIEMLNGWTDPPGYISPRTGVRFDNLDMAKKYPIIGKALEINRIMVYPDRKFMPIMDTWANQSSSNANINRGTFLLPAARVGRLALGTGLGQTQINMNFQPKYGHVHRDAINLTLFANGRELLPDLGYSHSSKYRWFTTSTMGHNTVVVNSQDMPNNAASRHGGNVEAFVTTDLFQTMRASYVGPYDGVSEYARELWLIPFADGDEREAYILDVFRVEGGHRHEYTLQGDANRDAVFHVDQPTRYYGPYLLPEGTKVTQPTGPSTPGSAQGHYSGYIYIRDVEQAELESDQFTVTLATSEYGAETPRLRITGLLDHAPGEQDRGDQLYLGRSPSMRPVRFHGISMDNNHTVDQHTMPKLVHRREGDQLRSDFVTLLEPFYSDGGSRIDVIQRMAIDQGPKGAVAVRIIYDDVIDIVLSNPHHDQGPLVVGELELHGEMGFIRVRDGFVREARLVGGTSLRIGDIEVTGTGKAIGTVLQTRRLVDGDGVDGIVTDATIAGDVAGKYAIITHPDGSTSGFEISHVTSENGTNLIVFAEHDPAFVIDAEGRSHQIFYPRKVWDGRHTVEIAYIDHASWTGREHSIYGALEGPTRRTSQATGTVVGTVHDDNGRPLADATVTLAGSTRYVAVTDTQGRFELSDLPAGTHWFKAGHELYASRLSEAVAVEAGQTHTITMPVGELLPPKLSVVTDEIDAGDSLEVTSSVDATIYLLRATTSSITPPLERIRTSAVATVEAKAKEPVFIETESDYDGGFVLYGVDAEGRVSSGVSVYVQNRQQQQRLIDLLQGWR